METLDCQKGDVLTSAGHESNIEQKELKEVHEQVQQQQINQSPSTPPPVVYGELSILGYNGFISNPDKTSSSSTNNSRRNRSKILLCKRPEPNGIKKYRHYFVEEQPQSTKAIQDKGLHSISFTFFRSQSIIVEYQQDETTDMFQIGRSSEEPIDFIVTDTVTANSDSRTNHNHSHTHHNHSHHHHHHHSRHHHHSSYHHNENASSNLNSNNHNHNINGQPQPIPANGGLIYSINYNNNNIYYHAQLQPRPNNNHYLNQNHVNHFLNHNNVNQYLNHNSNSNSNNNNSNNNNELQNNSTSGKVLHHNGLSQPSQHCQDRQTSNSKRSHATQSTISRFACRIIVDREPPYTARIYAAGFDSSRNIFLCEKATKWEQDDSIDGLTTNGVLISNTGIVWREVSVNGGIYAIRESRSAAQKGKRIVNETNVLQDGTLIDLCGATLLWRSLDGFRSAPTKKSLEEKIDQLNASRPQCPVGLNTLVIPRKAVMQLTPHQHHSHHHHHSKEGHHKIGHQPYVYLRCGHVQGYHDWGATDKLNQRTCPICMTVSTVSRLSIGIEPSFYVDTGPLTHSFNPCGHMATEKTVKYWSAVKIPYGTHFFHSICPFCAIPLSTTEPPFTKLIFQLDDELR